jgi:probable phosphoglycerate mutase
VGAGVLIIVRHGRTSANATGLLQGRVDNPLDAVGELQAKAIGAALEGLDRPLLLSSSLLRARQTAAILGAALGAGDAAVDDRFIELDYGDIDATPVRDVPPEMWARWRSDPDFVPPGGESLSALQSRVETACEEWAAEATDRDVVVVSHVSPIKAAIAWALGVGPATSWRMQVGQAAISRVRTGPGTPAVITFNETGHLVGVG